jgi:hypothetical protein
VARLEIGAFAQNLGIALLTFLFPAWYGPSAKYQPEDHYMRGPGPKWRAKHLAKSASNARPS